MITKLAAAAFGAMVFCDVASRQIPYLGKVGLVIWVLAIALICLVSLLELVRIALIPASPWGALVLAGTFAIIAFATYLATIRSANFENAQEIECLLRLLRESPSGGFRNYCHVGYPSRQFGISALLTDWFGPSFFLLHSGALFLILTGFFLFSAGTFQYGGGGRRGATLWLVAVGALAQFFWPLNLLGSFEQVSHPMSLSFVVVGLALLYHHRPDARWIWFGGIAALWLVHSYTPSLALVAGILTGALVPQFLKLPKAHKRLCLVVAAAVVISLGLSLEFRQDVQGTRSVPGQTPLDRLWALLLHLVGQRAEFPLTSPWVGRVLFLGTAVWALVSPRSDWRTRLVVGWVGSVVIAAEVFSSYAPSGAQFLSLHRATVAIPVFLGIFVTLAASLDKRILLPAGLLLAASGIFFQQSIFTRPVPDARDRVTQWIHEQPRDVQEKMHLFVDEALWNDLVSLQDKLRYFSRPTQYSPRKSTECPGPVPEGRIPAFVWSEKAACREALTKDGWTETALPINKSYSVYMYRKP